MKRNTLFSLISMVVIFVMLAGCGAPAAAPTATAEIINPPVIKDTEAVKPTATTAPTAEPTKEQAAAPAEPQTFTVNGVTMPFGRNEVVINDQVNFSVFDSFNPFIPNGVEFAAGWWQISAEYLWYVNYATGEIVPWLAEGFDYSEDYKTLTIHIRKGVTWNDGVPFTANDVAFTMNMLKNDTTLSGPGDTQYWDEVTATDDYTVVFKMSESRPRQHQLFYVKICTGQIIMPKHIWENQDPKTFKNFPPVTTGPYMLDKTYPDQKIFVWKRNDNYWNKDNMPKAKYVIYRTGPGADQQLAEIQSNNMDIFGMDYTTYVEKKAEIPQINLIAYVDPCPRGAFFNTAKAPFDKAEFRRAMSMLMNRPKWAENIWVPQSKPAVAPWADYRNLDKFINQEANDKWGTLQYNPEKAKQMLADLGYKDDGGKLVGPDGNQVKFEVGTPVGVGGWEYSMAQDWIEDLKAIGIDATLQNFEGPVWWGKVNTGDFDAGFWWMCGATIDPLELYSGFTSDLVVPIGETATRGNAMRLQDPELDEVVKKLSAINPEDPDALPLYMQAYDIFMRDAPGVPLIQTYYTTYSNTTYWNNMLSNQNLYTVPFNWWAQITFVLLNIAPK